jgi:adenine-specific DNA-methyltransferase
MSSAKNTGSYYTPDYLSGFMLRYVADHFNNISRLYMLEPSVGDGSFVRAFNNTSFSNTINYYSFTALDKVKPELKKANSVALANRKRNTRYSFTRADFLKFQKGLTPKYNLIAGNPPYLKKQLLNKTQIELCEDIHRSVNLSESSIKNIWSAFLIRCCQLLTNDGVLALVLPAELLQVKFAAVLRNFLTRTFQRIEIFTFDELLFDCKGQDTILLFGFKAHTNPGNFFTHINNTDQLNNNQFLLTENEALVTTTTKWSHHLIAADDLNFIYNIGKRLNCTNYYCDSKPGIVTAANSFFIVNEEIERKYNLEQYSQPIIQKGFFVNGSIVFDESDLQRLRAEGKPTKLLVFNDTSSFHSLPLLVQEYLKTGEDKGLHTRYKCKKRSTWYVVPNIATVSEGFFFKRSHHYPKLLKNTANVLVTDSAYKIEMRESYSINHLIFSFYNSLTLAFSELYGRYYGGGVLELTPQEFKTLPIPNVHINARDFNQYSKRFENKKDINDVLLVNDLRILNTSLGLSAEEIERVNRIYQQLISKRFRV